MVARWAGTSVRTNSETIIMTTFDTAVQFEPHVVDLPQLNDDRHALLFVDKDAATREVMRHAFEEYDIVFASGADEALRTSNARSYDLYVLEYWLPDWTGVALCREIRKTDPHVPVCFCTAAARPVDRQRAERAGARAYVLKPADPEMLKNETSRLMSLRAQRNHAARRVALSAIAEHLERRYAALPTGTPPAHVEGALKRAAHRTAKDTFLRSGGTLAGFERAWDAVWKAAWSRRP